MARTAMPVAQTSTNPSTSAQRSAHAGHELAMAVFVGQPPGDRRSGVGHRPDESVRRRGHADGRGAARRPKVGAPAHEDGILGRQPQGAAPPEGHPATDSHLDHMPEPGRCRRRPVEGGISGDDDAVGP